MRGRAGRRYRHGMAETQRRRRGAVPEDRDGGARPARAGRRRFVAGGAQRRPAGPRRRPPRRGGPGRRRAPARGRTAQLGAPRTLTRRTAPAPAAARRPRRRRRRGQGSVGQLAGSARTRPPGRSGARAARCRRTAVPRNASTIAGRLVERVLPGADRHHVGVVVLAGQLRGLDVPGQRRPHPGDLVRGDLLAVAGAADHHAEAARIGDHPGAGVQAERRVVVVRVEGVRTRRRPPRSPAWPGGWPGAPSTRNRRGRSPGRRAYRAVCQPPPPGGRPHRVVAPSGTCHTASEVHDAAQRRAARPRPGRRGPSG